MERENYGMNIIIEEGVRSSYITSFATKLKPTTTDLKTHARLPGSESLTQGHQDVRLHERLLGHGTR